jgi:methionyl-tRNA formyltransferase
VKICVAGKNAIAIKGLKLAISEIGVANVLVCLNDSDDGISRWQPSLSRYAREFGVRIVLIEDLYDIEDLIFISLEFDKIIDPLKFKTSNLFNMHFSLLPSYKGVYTSAWPIINGENISGVTLHKIDEGIDTGDIIDQIKIVINQNDTARDLYFSYLDSSALLLSRNFKSLINGNYKSVPQGLVKSSYYAKSSINYRNLVVNLKNTSQSLVRLVRGLHFREFQIPKIKNFLLGRSLILESKSTDSPGQIILRDSNRLIVSTMDFDVYFFRDKSWDLINLVEKNDISGIYNYTDEENLINLTNPNGWTALIIALYHGNIDICRLLINMGADVNKSNQNGTTPLMYAKSYSVRSNDFSLCKLLIDSGAHLHTNDNFGRSVIDYINMYKEKNAIAFFGKFN